VAIIRNNLEFYDQQAVHWWSEDAVIAPLQQLNPLRFAYFDRVISDWRGLKVLDVGCGGGFTCEFLSNRGAQVYGIDQSTPCIDAAKVHAEKIGLPITYCVGVAEALPFGDASFDVVVCVDVLEHVDSPTRTVEEIGRVLKPGDMFCFDTINRTMRSRLIMIWLLENLLRQIPPGIHDWHKFITPQNSPTGPTLLAWETSKSAASTCLVVPSQSILPPTGTISAPAISRSGSTRILGSCISARPQSRCLN
jgi:2-polyprenyl-6-hydroxyphenyl methylase/3-demethylubiquinone-9 3-methyltransferase